MVLVRMLLIVSFLQFSVEIRAASFCKALFKPNRLNKTQIEIIAGVLKNPTYGAYIENLLSSSKGTFHTQSAHLETQTSGEFKLSLGVAYTLSPALGSRNPLTPLTVDGGTHIIKGKVSSKNVTVHNIQQVDPTGRAGWILPSNRETFLDAYNDGFFSSSRERAFVAAALLSGEIEKHNRSATPICALKVSWQLRQNTAFIYVYTDQEIVVQGQINKAGNTAITNSFVKPGAKSSPPK